MFEELWQGIDFKLEETDFFLDRMGKVLVPRRYTDPTWHPAYGHGGAIWQPDFYYYLDAFIAAARSVPDIIQKCFGWDDKSKDKWPEPLEPDEIDRRKRFQVEFRDLYRNVSDLPLSRV